MFIELRHPIRLFAPAERDVWFDVLIYQYIALRWSAKESLATSINIWLLRSQTASFSSCFPESKYPQFCQVLPESAVLSYTNQSILIRLKSSLCHS